MPLSRPDVRSFRGCGIAWGILVTIVVGGLWILPALVNHSLKRLSSVARHTYELPEHVPFLTEEVALTFARRTLEREGYELEAWIPVADRRTRSPHGEPDTYLVRNVLTPNEGVIQFKNDTLNETRYIDITLSNRQVVCCLRRPL